MRNLGRLLTFSAFVFIGLAIHKHWPSLSLWKPNTLELLQTAALILLYGTSLYLLAYNWHLILRTVSRTALPVRKSLLSYTNSQVAKYIPGNVMHLVSRYMLLRGDTISRKALGLATVLELLSLPLAAISATALYITIWPLPLNIPLASTANVFAPFVVGSGLLVSILVLSHPYLHRWRLLCWVTGTACLFMLCLGASFWVVVAMLSPSPPGTVIPAAIIAWLIGFLTPGSPGGIGTREATLLIVLGDLIQDSTVLAAALIFRLITLGGDLICYLSGRILFNRPDT